MMKGSNMTVTKKTMQPGFSFIELLIGVTIIALFVGLVGPQLFKLLGRGQKTVTQSTLKSVAAGIKQYQMDTGQYPTKLEDLVKKPENITGWDGPYAGKEDEASPTVPQDAWHQDLKYVLKEKGSKPPFELYSLGDPNKEEDRINA